ncbi:MAG: GNAT family N-acetyltransferase [Candidatus Latescibacteria bacterium]|nr:GNAT family N-acetyltransferase [Candidatus Latescibacterota bacterium]
MGRPPRRTCLERPHPRSQTVIAIGTARADEAGAIRHLLQQVDLPLDELDRHLPRFLVARHREAVRGCVGLEIYGDWCIVRSLAVAPDHQGQGLGTQLLKAALDQARQHGSRHAVTLTNTAADLAARFGFAAVARDTINPAVQGSWSFAADACQQAACMHLRL